jgi:tetratricopeptide (TPR) repeat protein
VHNRSVHIVLVAFILAIPLASFAQRGKKKPEEEASANARIRQAEFLFIEGEKYFILEDYAKALSYFQKVEELDPENTAVRYKTAEILSKSNKQEDLEKAATSLEAALKLEKKNKYYYLLASNIYSNLTQFGKAEKMLEEMMKEIKGTDEYLYDLAALYQYDKKPDEAIKVYNRAEALMGLNEVSSIQKQRLLFEQGKTQEAIEEGAKLIAAFPDEERYVVGFAEMLAQNKQGAKAIPYLESFISEHDDSGNAKMVLANLYREAGEEKKSQELIEAAFRDPSIEAGNKVLMLGAYVTKLGQQKANNINDPALEAFTINLYKRLEEVHPTDPNVHIIGGDLNLTLKKTEEARQEYQKAIRYGSTSFEAWQNLLSLESELNEFDSLIAHSEAGLELFPNQAMMYYFNGYAQLRKNHYREAISSLEQTKRLSASNPNLVNEINGMLGDAYNSIKDYAKSDKAYDEALAANPNNNFVLNNYSYYLALRKENLEKAEKMAALLIKNVPNDANFLDTYAWVLYTSGKYKEAKKVMEKAVETGDAGATHFEHYGDILFQLGDVDEAVKQWQKAKSLDSSNEAVSRKIANRKLQ